MSKAINLGKGRITLDEKGYIASIVQSEGEKLLPEGINMPFIQIGSQGELKRPIAMQVNEQVIKFEFDNREKVEISYIEQNGYAVFEVVEIDESCDSIVFGPIPTNISKTIGEVIGVVRDEHYAIGIQALNIKTMPGFPSWYKEEAAKLWDIQKTMSEISVEYPNYCGYTAFETSFGSILQLYAENKSVKRLKNVRGISNVPVEAIKDEDKDIRGSKFALFISEAEEALNRIGEIELGEGLPHPMIGGEWAKTSREAMASYLITEFSEENIDQMIEVAEKAGFKRLYHAEPFETWGHFKLRSEHFPEGDESLVKYSKKANERGIGLGLHTLSNFTKTNDPYVSPVPDKRLMKMGNEYLIEDLDKEAERIYVTDDRLFSHVTTLQAIQIDDEIIQYDSVVKEDDKCVLKGCQRGAFGTIISEHSKEASVYQLFDHGYRIFFPNVELQDEYADRLVELFNKANIIQVSFDGLEGCRFEGEDEYGVSRLGMRCYEGWNHEVLSDASQLTHNLWHMSTYMNWGEPWRDKMRVDMTEHRIRNQEFYKKNLFPRMFGWFLIRNADRKYEATTLDDVEWALSEAAGYDAGFAFTIWPKAINALGNLDEILNTIKIWEKLRIKNSFSEDVREQLKDTKTEWHLKLISEENGEYVLYPVDMNQVFECDLAVMQPGQPGGADWVYINPYAKQNYECRILVKGDGHIENLMLTTAAGSIKFKGKVKGGRYLMYKGGAKAQITDKNYNVLQEVEVQGEGIVEHGQQPLSMTCTFGGEEEPEVRVTMVTYGEPITIYEKR